MDEKGKEKARIEKSTGFMTFSDACNRDRLETHPSVSLSSSKGKRSRQISLHATIGLFQNKDVLSCIDLGVIRAH